MAPRSKKLRKVDDAKGKVSVTKTGEFKVFDVKEKQQMKTLLEKNKIKMKQGRAYYELMKSETIQDYKRLVVMKKADRSFITGDAVRKVLKMPKETVKKFDLDLEMLPDFAVFVQSTSQNRVVLPDTRILYDIRETDGDEELPDADADEAGAKMQVNAPDNKKRGAITTSVPTKVVQKATGVKKNTGAANAVEIAFSFDTTGSMYACLGEVRQKLASTIQRLQADIPGIRIAVIAHGDYCDENSSYLTKQVDFTEDSAALCSFVQNVGSTGGGDADECYELVLHEARSTLSWSPEAQKSLVMIGDANPHEPSYPLNKKNLDWREECDVLKALDIRIYSVQCLNRSQCTGFYREMARRTDGFHLVMDQFASIVNFMLAICYNERGSDELEQFEEEMKSSGINRELHRLFDNLAGRTTAFSSSAGAGAGGLVPVNPSRFQVLEVDKRGPIKDFVQRNSLVFKPGRGFYEFTKAESISDKKEVVLVDRSSGDMFTGQEACDMIGAGGPAKIKPASLATFRVFVQSTSYTRVLVEGTGFLYEVDPDR